MSSTHPCRLLELPKEIRLMIYELLTTITRHYTITALVPYVHLPYSLTIITKRVPGIALIATCHQLHSEFSSHKNTDTLRPLRIIANWRGVGGAAMKAMLLCASRDVDGDAQTCAGSHELATMLMPLGGLLQPERNLIIQRDFATHEEIHNLLRHSVSPHTPLRVEIAIECDPDMLKWHGKLESYVWGLYRWLNGVSKVTKEGGEQEMHIVLRPMPVDKEADNMLEMKRAFMDEEFPEVYWKGRAWACEVGEEVGEVEWTECWEQGEK